MTDTFIWLGAAVILAIIELATYGLVTIWFAIGAVAAFGLSLFGISTAWQITVFAIVSALLLIFTKPILQKKLAIEKEATNADRVIGKKAIVMNTPDLGDTLFRVRVLEQVWTAKTEDNSAVVAGEEVVVDKIQGVKLIVKKIAD
jgi:Membrane protein implicated in regulation of membrane protease activity